MNSWQLQDAKSHFSQLVELASQGKPQLVTKHGRNKVIILSVEEYEQLTQKKTDHHSFIHALLSAPKAELDLTRTEQDLIPANSIFDDFS